MQRFTCAEDLQSAVSQLAAIEPRFLPLVERHGLPSLRIMQPGLESLLRIVTDQLISLKAGEAIWRRIQRRFSSFDTVAILSCSQNELRELGLSAAKARAFHSAAEAFALPRFTAELHSLPAVEVHRRLISIAGVGPWTAEIYLLSALQAADAWPAADLALQAAVQDLFAMSDRPPAKHMALLAEPWRPYRAAAARLLWCHYRALKRLPQAD